MAVMREPGTGEMVTRASQNAGRPRCESAATVSADTTVVFGKPGAAFNAVQGSCAEAGFAPRHAADTIAATTPIRPRLRFIPCSSQSNFGLHAATDSRASRDPLSRQDCSRHEQALPPGNRVFVIVEEVEAAVAQFQDRDV